MKRFSNFFCRHSTAQEQPLETGGKVLFYPDLALRTAGGDISVAASWQSYVLQDRELMLSQNPFSDEAVSETSSAGTSTGKRNLSVSFSHCFISKSSRGASRDIDRQRGQTFNRNLRSHSLGVHEAVDCGCLLRRRCDQCGSSPIGASKEN